MRAGLYRQLRLRAARVARRGHGPPQRFPLASGFPLKRTVRLRHDTDHPIEGVLVWRNHRRLCVTFCPPPCAERPQGRLVLFHRIPEVLQQCCQTLGGANQLELALSRVYSLLRPVMMGSSLRADTCLGIPHLRCHACGLSRASMTGPRQYRSTEDIPTYQSLKQVCSGGLGRGLIS